PHAGDAARAHRGRGGCNHPPCAAKRGDNAATSSGEAGARPGARARRRRRHTGRCSRARTDAARLILRDIEDIERAGRRCRADPNCATRIRGKRPSTVNGKCAPSTLILQHIRRYLEPYVGQSDSGALSKVWTPRVRFVVETGNELAVADAGLPYGIHMKIDPNLRCADLESAR